MGLPIDDAETNRAVLRRLHKFSRPYVLRISWCQDLADARSIQHNASCFAVGIGNNLFGVTASHVLKKYLCDQERLDRLHLMIDGEEIDLNIIELGEGIDIATFRIDEALLARVNKKCFVYQLHEWPPVAPEQGKGIVLTGYPREQQIVIDASRIDIVQVSNCLTVERIHSSNMAIHIRAKHLVSIDDEPIPPFSTDLGGYSGAPILTVSNSLSELYRLGGVLYEGARREDEEGEFVDLRAEPVARIRPDGRLNHGALSF